MPYEQWWTTNLGCHNNSRDADEHGSASWMMCIQLMPEAACPSDAAIKAHEWGTTSAMQRKLLLQGVSACAGERLAGDHLS